VGASSRTLAALVVAEGRGATVAGNRPSERVGNHPAVADAEPLRVSFRGARGREAESQRRHRRRPESAYLYCPNLEKTYRLVFELLDEVLTLFQPRWVHIGHDEVTNQGGSVNACVVKGRPPHQLFAADVRRLYEFLKGRGVGTMMWGDMLLRPDEAFDAAHGGEPFNFWLARRLLPNDIVIVDWHYQPAPAYPSVAVLRREGFRSSGQLGATSKTSSVSRKQRRQQGLGGWCKRLGQVWLQSPCPASVSRSVRSVCVCCRQFLVT
jgi:hypothetical protein